MTETEIRRNMDEWIREPHGPPTVEDSYRKMLGEEERMQELVRMLQKRAANKYGTMNVTGTTTISTTFYPGA